MTKAPYEVGDRVNQNELTSWVYTGLSGRPGKDKHAVRRYKKGMWVLEILAHTRPEGPKVYGVNVNARLDTLYWARHPADC